MEISIYGGHTKKYARIPWFYSGAGITPRQAVTLFVAHRFFIPFPFDRPRLRHTHMRHHVIQLIVVWMVMKNVLSSRLYLHV